VKPFNSSATSKNPKGWDAVFSWLTDDGHIEYEALVSAGNHSAQRFIRARILLEFDEGWNDPKIADALDGGRG
jgi:hypothetical protein